ncbi:histidine phosphatase family protein [Streptomyces sp. MS1.HAVA.3]|uniref:Histidine phosphatase family protein n=1 Tax=Streptomyces caledonius TaxID=3134107 RepID=A0ABU8TYB5_9ACTN
MSSGPAPHATSSSSDSAAGCRLLLVRHAKAAPKHVAEDFERSLSDRGRADAPETGRWLAESGFEPHLVLCSPARRTRETWELIAPALPDVPPAVYDDRLYNGAPDALATVLAEQGVGLSHVMLVGHGRRPLPDDAAVRAVGVRVPAVGLSGSGPFPLDHHPRRRGPR